MPMTMEEILGTLDYFVEQYQKRPDCGFFHHHGRSGKMAASKLLYAWQPVKRQLLQTRHDSLAAKCQAAQREIAILMGHKHLTGNYFQHSLKNYLLGFYFALDAIKRGQSFAVSQKELFKEHFIRKCEKNNPDDIRRAYNNIVGLTEKANFDSLLVRCIYGF